MFTCRSSRCRVIIIIIILCFQRPCLGPFAASMNKKTRITHRTMMESGMQSNLDRRKKQLVTSTRVCVCIAERLCPRKSDGICVLENKFLASTIMKDAYVVMTLFVSLVGDYREQNASWIYIRLRNSYLSSSARFTYLCKLTFVFVIFFSFFSLFRGKCTGVLLSPHLHKWELSNVFKITVIPGLYRRRMNGWIFLRFCCQPLSVGYSVASVCHVLKNTYDSNVYFVELLGCNCSNDFQIVHSVPRFSFSENSSKCFGMASRWYHFLSISYYEYMYNMLL